MKTRQFLFLFSCSFLFLNLKCRKDNPEVEKLPPLTQTGAGTFGCLVNGKIWKPDGKLFDRKLSYSYDPGYRGGAFTMQALRKLYSNNNLVASTTMNVGSSYVTQTGTYSLLRKDTSGALYNDHFGCDYHPGSEGAKIIAGELTISKLDMNTGIISGTFYFTLVKPNCDTLRATEGRFDIKL